MFAWAGLMKHEADRWRISLLNMIHLAFLLKSQALGTLRLMRTCQKWLPTSWGPKYAYIKNIQEKAQLGKTFNQGCDPYKAIWVYFKRDNSTECHCRNFRQEERPLAGSSGDSFFMAHLN